MLRRTTSQGAQLAPQAHRDGRFSSTPVNSDLNSNEVNTTVPSLQAGELRPRVK